MADTIVITKLTNGNVLINNAGKEYTLQGNYLCFNEGTHVDIRANRVQNIETFRPEDVLEVVRDDGTIVPISDNSTLFFELYTFFFFRLSSNGTGGITGTSGGFANFREEFQGDGVETEFQLDGSITNADFTLGSWDVDQILLTQPKDIANRDTKKPVYDSTNIFTRDRVSVVSISVTGLVTLDIAPRSGVDFNIYYWYDLKDKDKVNNYQKDDVVTDAEIDTQVARNVPYDPDNVDIWPNGVPDELKESTDQLANRVALIEESGGGGGGNVTLQADYRFSTSIVMADPGSRNFRLDDAIQGDSLNMALSAFTDGGGDAGNVIGALPVGTILYFQEDSTKFHRAEITGSLIDNTTWFQIPIIILESGDDITNNAKCHFIISAPTEESNEIPYTKTVFVNNSNGINTNAGRTPNSAVRDLSTAITVANSLTPSDSNQIHIIVNDSAIYSLSVNLTLPAFVHLFAPLATLDANGFSLICSPEENFNSVKFDRVIGGGVGVNIIDKLGSGNTTFTARLFDTVGGGVSSTAFNIPTGSMSINIPTMDLDGFGIVSTTGGLISLGIDSITNHSSATAGIFYAGASFGLTGSVKNMIGTAAGSEGINVLGGIVSLQVDNLVYTTGVALRVTGGRLNLDLSNPYTGAVIFGGAINIKGTPLAKARYITSGNTAVNPVATAGVLENIVRNVAPVNGILNDFTIDANGVVTFTGDYPKVFQIFMKTFHDHLTNPTFTSLSAVVVNDVFSIGFPFHELEETTSAIGGSGGDAANFFPLEPGDEVKIQCTTSNGDDITIKNESLQLTEIQPI